MHDADPREHGESFEFLQVEIEKAVATVTLNRPELHNAFNQVMIAELTACFTALASDPGVRVVVLTGAGRSFCAGADLQWMRESLHWSYDENMADAQRLAEMYAAIDRLPKPLIGRVNGAAIGGGAGLVACCDCAIAVEGAIFGFSEVKLGLVPAVIGRFVVPKIGAGQARALFVSGGRFKAERALGIGLIHQVVPADQLDAVVVAAVDEMLSSGPEAVARAKKLIAALQTLPDEEQMPYTVRAIAEARTSEEGQAGLAAFLDKQRPPWNR
jgi:methylglutaconyl-CoA hydratase